METAPVKRRLTAILAADAVGYSKRMGEDEERTLRTLAGHRKIIDGLIAAHEGRIVGTAGDSVLAEFGSSVAAVRCAVEIQEGLATRNDSLGAAERLLFRIGINLGDVIVEGTDILGDGVNVAARLESIAEPGGICIASSVFDQISGKLNLGFVDLGEQALKNIARPVRVYRFGGTSGQPAVRVVAPPAAAGTPAKRTGWVLALVAVAVIAVGGFFALGPPASPPPVSPPSTAAPPVAAAPAPVPEGVSEETRLKLQIAEVERATAEAELARARTEAAERKSDAQAPPAVAPAAAPPAATPTPTPAPQAPAAAPVSTPPPTPAAASPSAADGGSLAAFTHGTVDAQCEVVDDELGFSVQNVPVRIVDGEIILAVGRPGTPNFIILRGRPEANGTLVLLGASGTVPQRGGPNAARGGAANPAVGPRGRGAAAPARYQGKLVNGTATLVGRQGRRPCSMTMHLM